MNDIEVRLDKFLWAIRIYKTRSLAAEAIESGKVRKNGDTIKPSKKVKIGEQYTIKKDEFILTFDVIQLLDRRLSASLVVEYFKEISKISTKPKIEGSVFFYPSTDRPKGKGRPTKRERRDIDHSSDNGAELSDEDLDE